MRRSIHLIRELASLEPHRLWLLCRIIGLATVLPLLVRAFSLPRLVRLLDAGSVPEPEEPVDPEPTIRLTQAVLRRNFAMFRSNCMKQSLLLFHFLGKAGYPTHIRFGIKLVDGEIDGHCWLEHNGQPIAEPADPNQAVKITYEYPER